MTTKVGKAGILRPGREDETEEHGTGQTPHVP